MKKKYLTEFEEIQEALKKVRMDENVMPYHNGRLVENEDTYNKIQKLLDCPQMAESHRFLYDLDVEDLEESEIDKVDALFDLGVKKGFIDNSFEQELADDAGGDAAEEIEDEPEECCGEPNCSCGGNKAPVPCWTVLYSATKNGEVKTGECYSNAISVSAAKADCLAKLSRFGYENVSVLAIEAGDPDACCGECGEDDLLRDSPRKRVEEGVSTYDPDKGMTYSDYEIECTYDASPRGRGGMVYTETFSGIVEGASIKSMIGKAKVAIAEEAGVAPEDVRITEFINASHDGRDITDKANAVLAGLDESSKNPYVAGMKVVTGNTPKAKSAGRKAKKVDEDDEDAGSDDSGSDDSGSDDSGSDDSGSDDSGSDDSGSDDSGSDDSGSDDAGSDDTDSGDEGGDEGSDDAGSDDEGDDDSGSDDAGSDDSGSEDAGSDEGDDGSDEGDDDSGSDDAGSDDEGDDDSGSDDEGDEDSGDEDGEDSGSDDDGDDEGDDDELDDEQKAELKNEYSTAFKDTMLACEFEDKCFNDLTIDQKVKFFEKLAEKWTKADPKKFMSDKEQDQLDAIVATR